MIAFVIEASISWQWKLIGVTPPVGGESDATRILCIGPRWNSDYLWSDDNVAVRLTSVLLLNREHFLSLLKIGLSKPSALPIPKEWQGKVFCICHLFGDKEFRGSPGGFGWYYAGTVVADSISDSADKIGLKSSRDEEFGKFGLQRPSGVFSFGERIFGLFETPVIASAKDLKIT